MRNNRPRSIHHRDFPSRSNCNPGRILVAIAQDIDAEGENIDRLHGMNDTRAVFLVRPSGPCVLIGNPRLVRDVGIAQQGDQGGHLVEVQHLPGKGDGRGTVKILGHQHPHPPLGSFLVIERFRRGQAAVGVDHEQTVVQGRLVLVRHQGVGVTAIAVGVGEGHPPHRGSRRPVLEHLSRDQG